MSGASLDLKVFGADSYRELSMCNAMSRNHKQNRVQLEVEHAFEVTASGFGGWMSDLDRIFC